jgi:hypothetical protein
MKHFASPHFWFCYERLPEHIRKLADKNFEILKFHPENPNLRLKKVGIFWSARVGAHYRAIAKDRAEGLVWVWIGHHSEYDKLLKKA